jgi:hypothetical protein
LIAIYGLQHEAIGRTIEDVTDEIGQMPKKPYLEQWADTYERFGNILRRNPYSLLKLLDDSQYEWLLEKDKNDRSLSNLVEAELELNRSAVKR